jgi:hypothetical protein
MTKTITLRLDESIYKKIKKHAQNDNRPLSNYIETATIKFMEQDDLLDEFEMKSILEDKELIESLRRGSMDAKNRNGQFIE